jgi:Uma2 family endonuclease
MQRLNARVCVDTKPTRVSLRLSYVRPSDTRPNAGRTPDTVSQDFARFGSILVGMNADEPSAMNAMVDPMLDPALLAPERVRPLRRREYERLVELGAFHDERVELLRGVLVEMSPQGIEHSGITAWFARRLGRALDLTFEVRAHSPFAASDDSMPEPDVSVSIARDDHAHPSHQDALLLIEVADSSLAKDRVLKTEIYAAAGVPEYWIVDVRTRTVEVLRGPTTNGYKRSSVKRIGDELRPLKLRGVSFAVADIPWPIDEASPKRTRARRNRRG